MEEKIKNKNMYECLYCKESRNLFRFMDEDTIHILGRQGEYIVNFNSVEVICKKCGKKNYVTSNVADDVKKLFADRVKKNDEKAIAYIKEKSLLSIPYSILSISEKDRVFQKLSEKQRNIFNYLVSEKNTNIDRIMKKFRLNEITVIEDVKTITNAILETKPNFKQYYKTPCYLPEIRKRTVIKPSDT